MKKPKTISKLIVEYLDEEVEFCATYGEPGYTTPKNGILLANWNDVSAEFRHHLEHDGYELEWSDEWMVANNGKAYRTQPDCHHWESSIMYSNGDYLTPDDDIEDWLEACKAGKAPLPSRFKKEQIEAAGYTCIAEGLELGFFPGQDDNPYLLLQKYPDAVFHKTEQSQFYIKLSVYIPFGE
jgi:hypothetical protein